MNTAGRCKQDGCDRPGFSKGYCVGHYYRDARGQAMEPPIRWQKNSATRPCEGFGCTRPARAKGLCLTHYWRKRSGDENWNRPITHRHDGKERRSVGKVRADLLAELDRRAKVLGQNRGAFLEAILEQTFSNTFDADDARRVA